MLASLGLPAQKARPRAGSAATPTCATTFNKNYDLLVSGKYDLPKESIRFVGAGGVLLNYLLRADTISCVGGSGGWRIRLVDGALNSR
jgi:hypothetical protein